jgi:hypothetical protein
MTKQPISTRAGILVGAVAGTYTTAIWAVIQEPVSSHPNRLIPLYGA